MSETEYHKFGVGARFSETGELYLHATDRTLGLSAAYDFSQWLAGLFEGIGEIPPLDESEVIPEDTITTTTGPKRRPRARKDA